MALDFPANPTNGQVYDSYVYNSTVGAWQAREDSATVATISPVFPASANPGDIWYDSDDGTSYIYYDDGTSGQWVELLSSGLPLLNTKADLADPTFTNNVIITNDLNVNGTDINGDGKTIARFSDSWLRLNPDQDFSAGIYTNNSLIRTDNGLQVGANGANFLATSSALTHNGVDIDKKDGLQYYDAGSVGTATAANYYEIFSWVVGSQYNNFSTVIQVNGRGSTDSRYEVHVRGEYGVSTWAPTVLTVYSDHALVDGDTWIATFNNTTKTAKLYYRRSGSDWQNRIVKIKSNYLSGSTFGYANTNFGTTAPTGDSVITKNTPDPVSTLIMPSKTILQTVIGTYSGAEIGNSTSTYADTGLTATITPTSSTSTILILIYQALLKNSNTTVAVNYKLLRGTTDLSVLGSEMLKTNSANEWNGMQSFVYQDSPATTSSITYKTQFASSNGGPVVVANRGAIARMILMEIKA